MVKKQFEDPFPQLARRSLYSAASAAPVVKPGVAARRAKAVECVTRSKPTKKRASKARKRPA